MDADSIPSRQTASNSISFAFLINLETTTGWSGDTSAASPRKAASSESEVATFMAAPDSTNDGRTRTGYWTSAAKACA